MKLVFLGDSITRGTYTKEGDAVPMSVSDPNFAQLLSEKMGAESFVNYGTNGISYSATAPINAEYALINVCGKVQGDVIVVAAGTNDYGGNVEIGTYSDREDVSFCGAVRRTLETLKENNPSALIVVLLPINRKDEEDRNEKGYHLDQYRWVLDYIARECGCMVVDGRKLLFTPDDETFRKEYMFDGVHPNEAGHRRIAELLFREIIANLGKRFIAKKRYELQWNGHDVTVLVPENANGRWIWKTEFFYAFDDAETVLSDLGYTRVYCQLSDRYGCYSAIREMHEFHKYIVKAFSLQEKCNLCGFSRGGLYAFNYALFYPEYVTSVYLDAPVMDMKSWPPKGSKEQCEMFDCYALNADTLPLFMDNPIDNLKEFFAHKIPVLLIAGEKDEIVPMSENCGIMLEYCRRNGIEIETVLKPDCGHHPHSLEDASPIIAFLEKHNKIVR